MIVVVSGSRGIRDRDWVEECLDSALSAVVGEISEFRVGDASGVDDFAVAWGRGCGLAVRVFYPEWNLLGRSAGPIRNAEMLDGADLLVAIWDGSSRGTGGTIGMARAEGIKTTVIIWPGKNDAATVPALW